jgi:Flp pilus assembly protein TadG
MTSRRRIASEEGQTLVEFALVAPFLVVLLLAVIQFGIIFNNYVTLTDAARAGARKAVVARFASGNFDDAKQAVRDAASSLDQSKLDPQVTTSAGVTAGSLITVTATYPFTIDIPLLGMTVSTGTLTAVAKERLE